MEYDIYTDGACLRNGKPSAMGGWSFVVCNRNTSNVIDESYGKLRTGNQHSYRAEIEAVIQALKFIDNSSKGSYRIITDNLSVCECFKGLIERKANKDMWAEVEYLCLKILSDGKDIDIQHIKENKENKDPEKYYYVMNNLADKYARVGINSFLTVHATPLNDMKNIREKILKFVRGERRSLNG